MPCQDCLSIGIPERLCADGKPQKHNVQQSDLVFRRHNLVGNISDLKNLTIDEIGRGLFKLQDDSYNLSSLCEPLDVLFNDRISENGAHFLNQGIISIKVGDIESCNYEYNSNGTVVLCSFKVEHVSQDCNYSHAEFRYFINSIECKGKEPSGGAKKNFRRHLQKVMSEVKRVTN